MVHDLLSKPVPPCHDIWLDDACQMPVFKMQKLAGINPWGPHFYCSWSGAAVFNACGKVVA